MDFTLKTQFKNNFVSIIKKVYFILNYAINSELGSLSLPSIDTKCHH